MEHIFIVEDEVDIAALLAFNLERVGFKVTLSHDGKDGLAQIKATKPDLIILDVMLPSLDGYQILSELQQDSLTIPTPVIMLSARVQEEDYIRGLKKGADAYLAKPFSPKELIKSVKEILTRNSEAYELAQNCHEPLDFDQSSLQFKLSGTSLLLSSVILKLLGALAHNEGQITTRKNLSKAAWGQSSKVYDEALDRQMDLLLKKLGEHQSLIKSIPGKGFIYDSKL